MTTWLSVFLVVALLVVFGIDEANETPPTRDEFRGGTAREWQQQTEDWQKIAFKFKGVAAKYRKLNYELLAELGQ